MEPLLPHHLDQVGISRRVLGRMPLHRSELEFSEVSDIRAVPPAVLPRPRSCEYLIGLQHDEARPRPGRRRHLLVLLDGHGDRPRDVGAPIISGGILKADLFAYLKRTERTEVSKVRVRYRRT